MTFFCVTGKGDFPFHMLAVSKAWPVDAHEAHRIALSCPTVAPEQRIWLETQKGNYPNVKLWAAEKWPVIQTQ
jgi:hypothetical protein